MSILGFLKDRDVYISTEVYVEFKDKLKEAGIKDADVRDMSRRAVQRASENWDKAMDEGIRAELESVEVSGPELPVAS